MRAVWLISKGGWVYRIYLPTILNVKIKKKVFFMTTYIIPITSTYKLFIKKLYLKSELSSNPHLTVLLFIFH